MKLLRAASRAFAALAVIVIFVTWLHWGTLNSCEAFKREVLWQFNDAARTPVQKARLPRALRETRRLLEDYMPSVRPRQCMLMLWRTNVDGVPALDVFSPPSIPRRVLDKDQDIKRLLPKLPGR